MVEHEERDHIVLTPDKACPSCAEQIDATVGQIMALIGAQADAAEAQASAAGGKPPPFLHTALRQVAGQIAYNAIVISELVKVLSSMGVELHLPNDQDSPHEPALTHGADPAASH